MNTFVQAASSAATATATTSCLVHVTDLSQPPHLSQVPSPRHFNPSPPISLPGRDSAGSHLVLDSVVEQINNPTNQSPRTCITPGRGRLPTGWSWNPVSERATVSCFTSGEMQDSNLAIGICQAGVLASKVNEGNERLHVAKPSPVVCEPCWQRINLIVKPWQ
jgi:hypothetical protein